MSAIGNVFIWSAIASGPIFLLLLGFVAAGRAIGRALTRAEWPRRR